MNDASLSRSQVSIQLLCQYEQWIDHHVVGLPQSPLFYVKGKVQAIYPNLRPNI